VLLERCIIDVVKFVSLYVLWNLGFTLAFFTMQVGGKFTLRRCWGGGATVRLKSKDTGNSLMCNARSVL
jgi:hypothetical protein